jgi:hypothetical protein
MYDPKQSSPAPQASFHLLFVVISSFNFTLERTIRRVQVNQGRLKLNGRHQLLAYADGVNILGASIHAVKENAEALVVAAKLIGLEVNADKTKCMVYLKIRMQNKVTM